MTQTLLSRLAALVALAFTAPACTADPEPQGESADAPPAADAAEAFTTATVFYIRHAFSCANARPKAHAIFSDPILTDCGLFRSIQAGQRFAELLHQQDVSIDFWGASTLLRAKETALMMGYTSFFPQGNAPRTTLWELPYISEAGLGLDNTAASLSEQKSFLEEQFGVRAGQLSNRFSEGAARNAADFFKFEQDTLPRVIEFLATPGTPSHFHLAVVTHSHLMQKQIGCVRPNGEKPANNEVFKVEYTFDANGQVIHKSPCKRVLEVERETAKAEGDLMRCPTLLAPAKRPKGQHALTSGEDPAAFIGQLSQSCHSGTIEH